MKNFEKINLVKRIQNVDTRSLFWHLICSAYRYLQHIALFTIHFCIIIIIINKNMADNIFNYVQTKEVFILKKLDVIIVLEWWKIFLVQGGSRKIKTCTFIYRDILYIQFKNFVKIKLFHLDNFYFYNDFRETLYYLLSVHIAETSKLYQTEIETKLI